MKLFKKLILALVFAMTATTVSITAFATEQTNQYADDVSYFLDDEVEVTRPDESTTSSVDTDRVTAAKRALESCARYSYSCRFAGCQ